MKSLFVCFYMCFACSLSLSAQRTISGSVAGRNSAPLAGVHVLLYPAGDSIRHVTIDVTDTLGAFRLNLVPDGEYRLVAKHIGMETVTRALAVSGKDLALGTIRMREADHRLGEVAVEAGIPEWTLAYPVRIDHVYFSPENPNQRLDHRKAGLQDFEGRWQWKSANQDTILTIELCEVEVTYLSHRRSKGVTPFELRLRRIYNYLIGRYEYQIKDSVLFSCMQAPVKWRQTLVTRTVDNRNHWPEDYNEKNQDLLKSEKWFPQPANGVYLRQNRNPLGRHRAWVRLTMLNAEKTLLYWHTDVYVGTSSGALHIRKALNGELGLPNDVVMRKVGEVGKQQKRNKKRRRE